jgi:hypothetical protein
MNTQGPYYINPYGGQFGPASRDIPVIVGRFGYVEVINTSFYNIFVTLQSMGTVYQEARSKVLYRLVQESQGTQMVTILARPNANSPESARQIRLPVSLQNGETGLLGIFINTYEEGEIEPYPPQALAGAAAPSSYFASADGTAGFSLVLPNTSTFFGVAAPLGTCDLLGFDCTLSFPSTSASGALVISNLNNQPDGSTILSYQIGQFTASINQENVAPLLVRYPTPLPNFLGSQITFTVPNISSAHIYLNAYYSLT